MIDFSLENGILLSLHLLHVFKPLDLTVESILSACVMLLLHLLELLLPNLLICDCEILIESILLYSN